MPKEAIGGAVGVPLSPAIRVGNVIFVSGQVPTDDSGKVVPGGIEAETKVVMDRIKSLLEQAGATMDDVVKTTVFLTDINDFRAMNKVYATYFPGTPPARSTFEVKLAIDAKIEVEAIAIVDR